MKNFFIISGNKTLTVLDAPVEDDFFEHSPNYDGWIEVFLAKEVVDCERTQ